jgi:hypothetical protein
MDALIKQLYTPPPDVIAAARASIADQVVGILDRGFRNAPASDRPCCVFR